MRAPEMLTARARRSLPADRQLLAVLAARGLTRQQYAAHLAEALGVSPGGADAMLARLLAGAAPLRRMRAEIENDTGIPAAAWDQIRE